MRLQRNLYLGCVMTALLAVSFWLYKKPAYNWDIFPYMALAARSTSIPFDSTHSLVYREASRRMSAGDFKAVSERQPELMKDPDAFRQVLKYFEIKPAYVFTTRILHAAGFDLVTATYLPSVISYFVVGLLLFWWLQKIFPLPVATVLTLLLVGSSVLITPARYSSPDMLCALFCFVGLYVATEVAAIPGLIISGLAIIIRPDAVIPLLVLNAALYRTQKIKPAPAVMITMTAVGATLLLARPGLLMEMLFVTKDYSSAWSFEMMVVNYASSLWQGLNSITRSLVPVFATVGIVTLFVRMRAPETDLWTMLVALTLGSLALRFFLHPVIEDRFLVSTYLLIVIGFCKSTVLQQVVESGGRSGQNS